MVFTEECNLYYNIYSGCYYYQRFYIRTTLADIIYEFDKHSKYTLGTCFFGADPLDIMWYLDKHSIAFDTTRNTETLDEWGAEGGSFIVTCKNNGNLLNGFHSFFVNSFSGNYYNAYNYRSKSNYITFSGLLDKDTLFFAIRIK